MEGIEQFERLAETFPNVAAFFKNYWQTPIKDYSTALYQAKKGSFEKELKEAIADEWQPFGLTTAESLELLEKLEQRPVLQTSHHVTPTNGPTFLAIDLISIAGLPDNEPYLVAANSGVAFSNTAWSGALSYGSIPLEALLINSTPAYHKAVKSARDRENDGKPENRISLVSSKQRDQLVFATKVPGTLTQLFSQFSASLQECLSTPMEQQLYSVWACKSCSNIQNRILNKNKVFYFDINRIISNYLIRVLSHQKDHPLVELLFSDRINREFNQVFQKPQLFLGSYQSKKSTKIEGFSWLKGGIVSEKSAFKTLSRTELVEKLKSGELCPGVFLQFFVLKFINGIKCLGSFHQVEYLENFRNRWLEMNPQWGLNLKPEEGPSLTTGRLLRDGNEVWPLDLAMRNEQISVGLFSNLPMSRLWEPIAEQLAG